MRKDPPVDEDFMNALHLLSQAESEGANIINRPSALQKFNEKVFALQIFSIGCLIQMLFAKKRTLKNSKKNTRPLF